MNSTLQPSAFSLQPCPFGFQSKYYDAETGFWYYGYRFFDSRSGKWLTSDPIQEAGGLNLTEFCGGDPVNRVDARGLFDDRTMFAYLALTHPDAFSAYQDLHASGRMDYLGQRDTWRNVTWDRSRSYYSTRSTRFWLDEDLTAEAAATLLAREVRAHPAYDATGFAAAEGDAERQLALHGANLGMGMQQAGMLAGMYVDGIASLVPGNDAVEAIRGKSATGQDLAGWQRALAAVPAASMLACLRRADSLDDAVGLAASMGTRAGLGKPRGVPFEGTIWRYEHPDRLATTWKAGPWNVNATHRYSKKGIGATYGSLTKATARREVEHWTGNPSGRVAVSRKVRMTNLLDLRDAAVRREVGVTLENITGDSYEHTHRIGEWALEQGYEGVIAPSARFLGSPGRANLVIFGGL